MSVEQSQEEMRILARVMFNSYVIGLPVEWAMALEGIFVKDRAGAVREADRYYYGNIRCEFHPILLGRSGRFSEGYCLLFPPNVPSGSTQGGKKPSLQSVEHRGETSDFSKALTVFRLVG